MNPADGKELNKSRTFRVGVRADTFVSQANTYGYSAVQTKFAQASGKKLLHCIKTIIHANKKSFLQRKLMDWVFMMLRGGKPEGPPRAYAEAIESGVTEAVYSTEVWGSGVGWRLPKHWKLRSRLYQRRF